MAVALAVVIGVLLTVTAVFITVLCVRRNHRKAYVVDDGGTTTDDRYILPNIQIESLDHVSNGSELQNTEVESSLNETPGSSVQNSTGSSPHQQQGGLQHTANQHTFLPTAMTTHSTVDHTQRSHAQPVTGPALHPLDSDINPEVIQRQIVKLRPQWRSFGSAAGLPHQFLDEVHSSYTDNKDRLAEVVYEWYGRMRTVTWADVAGMCRKIGHCDLADALGKAYDTGVLPFKDDKSLPLICSSKDLPPPPLPPRGDSETPPPELPPPPPPDALDDLFRGPPKPSTEHESHVARAPLAPPRPPKSSTKSHLPPRT